MKRAAEHVINNAAVLPAIRLGAQDGAAAARRAVWLTVFMRSVAILWIIQGLAEWADVLMDPSGDFFAQLTGQRVAAVLFFCVLDFVAAIGLWLATPWGGVVWLVTVGAQLLALALLPGFWGHGVALAASDAVLVGLYFFLVWYAGHGIPR